MRHVNPNGRCAECGAPERRLWTPRADVPVFETVAERSWSVLGRCATCTRYWVQGSYEPYGAFTYWVLWPLDPEAFAPIADLADGLVIEAWVTAEIKERAASLPPPDRAAIGWHHERSYGRDPAHELEPLPKPDIDWMAAALRGGNPRVMRVTEDMLRQPAAEAAAYARFARSHRFLMRSKSRNWWATLDSNQ
jgi:hypothetical protein